MAELWWAVGGILALAALFGSAEKGGGVLADFLAALHGRGSRVGPSTSPNSLGVIQDDPQSLADSAALDLDVYALARAISSEEGNSPKLQKVAVGWAITNYASGRGIENVLLAGRGPTSGYFARQNARYQVGQDSDGNPQYAHAGKYASTAIDPYQDDVAIATAVLNRSIEDPTGGATNFFSPRVQDVGFDAGKPGYTKDSDEVIADWTAKGLAVVEVPGIDPHELTFFRPGGAANG